ncbi:MAG TPA: hypothetical protein GXX36_07310 [Clostridiaceae bacterium]|nr:hypothetical protein [Clostridiaceae bacterium]
MIIFRFSKKKLIFVLSVVLVFSIGFNILSFLYISDLQKDYNSLVYAMNQLDRSNIAAFIGSDNLEAQGGRDIEIFDVAKGIVIKRINPDSQTQEKIQREVRRYLNQITGMFVKVNALPDSGYIVRLPLEPYLTIQNQWLNQTVKEVFVIFSEGAPYLLVLDENERPFFYNFDSSTDELLKLLEFNPEEQNPDELNPEEQNP